MKTISFRKRILSIILAATLLVCLCSCSGQTAKNLAEDISADTVQVNHEKTNDIVTNDFAMELFKKCLKEEDNTLISPMSVLCALAMTANGAEGETKAQMEEVLGMTVEQLNQAVYTYRNSLPDKEKCKVTLSNSIWFTEHVRFTANEEFLQTNADYYGADIFEAPFDNSTVRDINNWVRRKTDGMITNVIDNIPSSAVMYLINALTFDAEWQEIYKKTQIWDGEFTAEDGTAKKTDFMYSEENYYLENEFGTGVMKYYKGGDCAFVALLPEEGMTIKEYVNSLTGADIYNMLENVQNVPVTTAIPKFETSFSLELADILQQMGMTDAFDQEKADFSGLGTSVDGNISIDRVLHKTYINVDEKGTKAGAVTIIEATDGCAIEVEEPKEVILDRPFVYMIVDMENQVPLFVGTVMDVE